MSTEKSTRTAQDFLRGIISDPTNNNSTAILIAERALKILGSAREDTLTLWKESLLTKKFEIFRRPDTKIPENSVADEVDDIVYEIVRNRRMQ